jgi:hypothetical protein
MGGKIKNALPCNMADIHGHDALVTLVEPVELWFWVVAVRRSWSEHAADFLLHPISF